MAHMILFLLNLLCNLSASLYRNVKISRGNKSHLRLLPRLLAISGLTSGVGPAFLDLGFSQLVFVGVSGRNIAWLPAAACCFHRPARQITREHADDKDPLCHLGSFWRKGLIYSFYQPSTAKP
jgi:hypothetical protein